MQQQHIAFRPLEGEIMGPSAIVRVIGRVHPLSGARVDREFAAGLSIAELLEQAAGGIYGSGYIVHLDGHPIAPENFRRIRVKAGTTLTFQPRLQNGNVWKVVFSVVIAVAALVIAPWATGLLGLTGLTATLTTAAISAGVMLAGTLLLNALFPTRPGQLNDNAAQASLISIQGAQNQDARFGSVPVVLGRHRQSPFYAAKPYTEIVGDDQYLRLLFCLGYGPLAIEDLQIGETPLAQFADCQVEIRQGYVGDAPISLYPSSVDEHQLSIKLDDAGDQAGQVGGPNVQWQTQTSAADADLLTVDFTATEGIFRVNQQNGNYEDWTVHVATSYRAAGSSGAWIALPDVVFTRSVNPTRRGLSWSVARGQYEVRCCKNTGNGGTTVKDTIYWTALRATKYAAPITFPKPLALVGLRIRATDQLNGVINTLNCVTTSLVTAYSGAGSVWTPYTASQWPPDLFRHVLQGPANARPVADSQIDLVNLQQWWAYCVANGFKFNQVVASVGSVFDKLCDIAAAGRAVPTFIDGKWGVVWDRPTDPIVQHFTPRNSWGMRGNRVYSQQPHGWRVTFINEDNGYTQDERIVYDDGYDAGTATLFEGLQFPGVTDPDLIWRHGRFHIAQARLRPESLTLNVGWEHLVCTRGDRVRVTHDVMLIGQVAGRVKAVAGQVVTLDEVMIIEAGKTYGITFRVPEDARSIVRAVDPSTLFGEYTSVTLIGDLSLIVPGTLAAFGETNQQTADYRVQSITHQKDLVAQLVLVDDAPAISQADYGAIPAYVPHVSVPPDPFTLPPRDLKYLEVIDGQGASVRALVRLTWQIPRFGRIQSFEVQQRDDDAGGGWVRVDAVLPPGTSVDVPLIAPGTWSFRVRCLFIDGTASDWASVINATLLGLARPPSPIANLRNTYINGRSFLSWDDPIDPRIIPIEIRKGQSFAAGQIIADAASAPWQTVGDDIYWVSSYVTGPFGTRVYSSPTQSIEIIGSIAVENVIVDHDERAEGWTGTFTGSIGVDQGNNFLRTSTSDPFLARPDFLGTPDMLDGDGVQVGGTYWSAHVVDTGGITFCRVSNNWTATGVPTTDDFLGNPDFLGSPDFLKASLAQYIRVRPVIRVSMTGPVPNWGAPQVWSPDVYQGRMFQLGMSFEILSTDQMPDPGVIAYLLGWSWSIDVPDRFDSYQDLVVPAGAAGLVVKFRPVGSSVDVPFNGGVNDEALPHLAPSIQNPNPGDQVVWSNLTLSGVTLKVMNAGASVGGSKVNLLVRGY